MLASAVFILLMLFASLASAGSAKMFMILTQPDELLGGWHPKVNWNKVLMRLEATKGEKNYYLKDFWHKRLGSCIICTRQQFNDMAFLFLMITAKFTPMICPTSFIEYTWLKIIMTVVLYIGFSGVTLYIGQLMEYEKREADSLEQMTEQTPVTPQPQKRNGL